MVISPPQVFISFTCDTPLDQMLYRTFLGTWVGDGLALNENFAVYFLVIYLEPMRQVGWATGYALSIYGKPTMSIWYGYGYKWSSNICI